MLLLKNYIYIITLYLQLSVTEHKVVHQSGGQFTKSFQGWRNNSFKGKGFGGSKYGYQNKKQDE